MYTGITQGLFNIITVDRKKGLLVYTVELSSRLAEGLKVGHSVSIDGVCQTVANIENCKVTFNAMAETLSKTTLRDIQLGQKVSVERSVRYGDENGGHELAGHVFEVGTVAEKKTSPHNITLTLKCSSRCIQYIFEKGFIGIEGSSLTVGNVDKQRGTFEIHLIPETVRLTNFGNKQIGDKVNIEIDSKGLIIFEAMEKYFSHIQRRLDTLEKEVFTLKNTLGHKQ